MTHRAFHTHNLGIAAVCVPVFVAALIAGEGLVSFAFLFAAVWWAAVGLLLAATPTQGAPSRGVRAKRLQRERFPRAGD